jgi:MoxR-like ATPase
MVDAVRDAFGRFCDLIETVLVGKRDVVELATTCLFGEGHLLLEDVPGVGKTTLARALATACGGAFHRVQCTPDLLPFDITGVSVYDQRTTEFVFRPGPVFANVLMVDEINRATPRTQSAVLEAMQERQVSVDGITHPLPRPFMVVATQNPIELEGTFPLPEAQLDRFLMRLSVGYPDLANERALVDNAAALRTASPVSPFTPDELLRIQARCREVRGEPDVRDYLVAVVRGTREGEDVKLGASPRATLDLWRAAQTAAAVDGRDFVIPDDVKRMAVPVLAHRLVLTVEARVRGRTGADVVADVLDRAAVPVEARL